MELKGLAPQGLQFRCPYIRELLLKQQLPDQEGVKHSEVGNELQGSSHKG